jgi:pyrroline-5-carboxylate reductase
MHPTRLTDCKIAFIGAGSMAEAIIRGLTTTGTAQAEHLYAINRTNEEKNELLRSRYHIHATCDSQTAAEWIRAADIVVLGFKPQNAAESLRAYRPLFSPRQLIVSLIAGLSLDSIGTLIGEDTPVVRTMPNTSSQIGLGATGISFSGTVLPEQRSLAKAMFAAVGETAEVDEALLDIVTGVSGSGPAYIYYMMESMIAGGIRGGLSPEMAKQLTVQTVLGAASMVKMTDAEPAELRRKVTSPNGTTFAALTRLDEFQFSEGVQQAVLRAAERAGELRDMISRDASAAQSEGGANRS